MGWSSLLCMGEDSNGCGCVGKRSSRHPRCFSNGMNGRKREGTVEIPGGRRRLRRRKRAYKAQAEVACDAAGKSEEAVLARKAWTAKPAGAKGLYSSQAFEEGGTA